MHYGNKSKKKGMSYGVWGVGKSAEQQSAGRRAQGKKRYELWGVGYGEKRRAQSAGRRAQGKKRYELWGVGYGEKLRGNKA